jgi:hypothetical protein
MSKNTSNKPIKGSWEDVIKASVKGSSKSSLMNKNQKKILLAIKNDPFSGYDGKDKLIRTSGIQNLVPELTQEQIKIEMIDLGVKTLSDTVENDWLISIPANYFDEV